MSILSPSLYNRIPKRNKNMFTFIEESAIILAMHKSIVICKYVWKKDILEEEIKRN